MTPLYQVDQLYLITKIRRKHPSLYSTNPPAGRRVLPPKSSMAIASHFQPLLFIFLLTINHLTAQPTLFNAGFLLPLTKDPKSLQYTTQLLIGTPQLPTKLVVHLSGQSLWIDCTPPSSSRHFIRHRSLQCVMAKSGSQRSTTICDIHQQNPITGASNFGDLAQDVITFDDGIGSPVTVDEFLLSCSPEYLLKRLVTGAKGMLGFGRSKIAFQSQIVNNFDFPRTFTVCLSSSDGFIMSGTGISNSLSYTPLIFTSTSNEYYVNVNSIKVNGRRLVNDAVGNVKLSSVVPYTTMKSSIYEIFTKAYVKAATSMNMTVVAPVAPFRVCFSSHRTPAPQIELVLQSELVKFRMKSMVEVSDSVMCLGFIDGGDDSNSMVVGGYQLEDHILEFNLGTSMMGFSSLLTMEGKRCSKIIPFVLNLIKKF